jgi:hypothetical protein
MERAATKGAEMTAMTQMIERYGDFAAGGNADDAAAAWHAAGFSADEAAAWLDARCFDADSARRLADAGVTTQRAAELTDEGAGEYSDTIGYKVSNRDLTIDEIA